MKTIQQTDAELKLIEIKKEVRVDSRLIADQLGIKHKNLLETIDKHLPHIERLGVVPFQTEKPRKGSKGGRPEKLCYLNEDQSIFLMTLSKNTERVVELKFQLVKAFSRYREGQQGAEDYLPYYHTLHDSTALLAKQARESGSTAAEWTFHSNINRAINKAFGIEAGTRSKLPGAIKVQVTNAQLVANMAIERCLEDGIDHHEAYQRVKGLVTSLARAGMITDQRGVGA